jgi:hypothetical protein
MPVTSSSFTLDPYTQTDGSRWVRELHTLLDGARELRYLLAPGGDATAIMQGRVAAVNEALADEEAEANFERDGALTLNEMTAAEFANRLRLKYRNSDKADTCRLAWWLLRRIAAGHITDAQCRTAFGLTTTQWTNFKTNTLTPQSNAWAAVLAATGS